MIPKDARVAAWLAWFIAVAMAAIAVVTDQMLWLLWSLVLMGIEIAVLVRAAWKVWKEDQRDADQQR